MQPDPRHHGRPSGRVDVIGLVHVPEKNRVRHTPKTYAEARLPAILGSRNRVSVQSWPYFVARFARGM